MMRIDEETDLGYLEERARKGNLEAAFQVAMRYTRGESIPRDYGEALPWLENAAKRDHPYAQYRLGMAYLMGLGVERDFFEAAIWFAFSAARNVEGASVALEIVRHEYKTAAALSSGDESCD